MALKVRLMRLRKGIGLRWVLNKLKRLVDPSLVCNSGAAM